ncbi:MAG TPA: hypothetical protein VFL27_07070 [Candidatus Dormibacteraeota bacterium]|nr:hypothetical protein [Candidatus Dormibacteraeota bacterium]
MQPPPPPAGYPQQPVPYGQPYGLPDAQGSLVSMILGIIGLVLTPLTCCCGVGAIVPLGLGIAALVLGFQARSKIAAAPGALGGSGKALAGIITGGTAVGISLVLLLLVVVLRVATPSILNAFPTPT